jgi:multidrug resistance protein, MATE family
MYQELEGQRDDCADLRDATAKTLLTLAWPIALSLLSYSVMTVIDTAFVSGLGTAALSGVGLGGTIAFVLLCFPIGLMRAVKILVAQSVGAGRREDQHAYLAAGLVLSMLIGALAMGLGYLLAEPFSHMTATPDSGAAMRTYLRIRLLGSLPVLVHVVLEETRNALGDVRAPMRAALIANAVHIALGFLLVSVLGCGVAGAAANTVLCQCLEVGLVARAQSRDGFEFRRLRLRHLASLWSLGWPTAIQFALEVGSFALLGAMLATWREVDSAAHQIAIQVSHLSFLPAFALADASCLLVGRAIGSGRPSLVPKIARTALLLASIYTGACTLLFALAADPITRLFTSEPELSALTRQLLHVACLFLVADSANAVARCILRGTGDVRVPALIGVLSAWLCTPPLTYLLGLKLGFGAIGAWSGFCLEIIIGAIILWRRVIKLSWRGAARRSYRLAHQRLTTQ